MAKKQITPVIVLAPSDDSGNGTSASRKRVVTYGWNNATRVLTQNISGNPAQTFDTAQLPTEIMDLLAIHGLRQKLADSHAGKIPEAVELSRDVWDGLVAGNWSTRGEGAERTTLFLEAYCALKGRDINEFRKLVNDIESGDDEKRKSDLAAVRDNKDVKAKMREIAAQRAVERAEAAKRAAATGPAEVLADI